MKGQTLTTGNSVAPSGDTPATLLRLVRPGVRVGNASTVPPTSWVGEPLLPTDLYLALVIESYGVGPEHTVPRIALAVAGAGPNTGVRIHADDVGRFVLAHRALRFVCADAASGFWAVEHHLRVRGEHEAVTAWWAAADAGRLHDPMLLDALVRLARDDSPPTPRTLAAVARATTGADLGTAAQGPSAPMPGPAWVAAAVEEAVVTRSTYLALRKAAREVLARAGAEGGIIPDARHRYGLLTEAVQVKKAIALAAITRNGLRIDAEYLRRLEADLRLTRDAAVRRARESCPDLYRSNPAGDLVRGGKADAPSVRPRALERKLGAVAASPAAGGGPIDVPVNPKTGCVSTAADEWRAHAAQDPFVADWLAAEDATNTLRFLGQLTTGAAHPQYEVLVRTGRTACRSPNVQQVPRGDARTAFVASPGHLLLAADYSFAELRALAAVCLRRYGASKLADVIRAGGDPHAHTAAGLLGLDTDEFLAWERDPDRMAAFGAARRAAKAVNFGVPGGLGIDALRKLARTRFGVTLTEVEARAHRDRLTTVVYPELGQYLADDGYAVVARNIHAAAGAVRAELDGVPVAVVRGVLAGPPKGDGGGCRAVLVSRVWAALGRLNTNPELAAELASRTPGTGLASRVCDSAVSTLTGRVRGRVGYTSARNTPFQGLAADGAGLALFGLVREGFRVVAFVHDEVLVELPADGDSVAESAVRRVEEILCEAMASVLGGVPVACELTLSASWGDHRPPVFLGGRAYPGPVPA